jgi:hypothetical protein
VTTRDHWPIIAGLLGFATTPGEDQPRSSREIGDALRSFSLRILGGLEILWERTKIAEGPGSSTLAPIRPPLSPPWAGVPHLNGNQGHSVPTASHVLGHPRQPSMPIQVNPRSPVFHPPTPVTAVNSGFSVMPPPTNIPHMSIPNANLQHAQPAHLTTTQPLARPPIPPIPVSGPSRLPRPVEYDPPVVSNFDELVQSNILPLPHSSMSFAQLPPAQHFAMRCHELRAAIKRMAGGSPIRQVSREEMVFWNKLCKSCMEQANHSENTTAEPNITHPGSKPYVDASDYHSRGYICFFIVSLRCKFEYRVCVVRPFEQPIAQERTAQKVDRV